jgi:hypothetical protein
MPKPVIIGVSWPTLNGRTGLETTGNSQIQIQGTGIESQYVTVTNTGIRGVWHGTLGSGNGLTGIQASLTYTDNGITAGGTGDVSVTVGIAPDQSEPYYTTTPVQ